MRWNSAARLADGFMLWGIFVWGELEVGELEVVPVAVDGSDASTDRFDIVLEDPDDL
jgi:hypothetical protein